MIGKYEFKMELKESKYKNALISKGVDGAVKCIKEHGDWATAITILQLCKYIGKDDFEVRLERESEVK